MTESDTPRTDAMAKPANTIPTYVIYSEMKLLPADFARELERELAAARAERDSLRADAERYRWLRDNVTWFDPKTHVRPTLGDVSKRIFYHASSYEVDSLDTAIDAARATASAGTDRP